MSSAFIFIATTKRVPGLVEFIAANEPRLIAFNEYVNEAGDDVTVVQIHPDTASMEAHIGVVRARAQEAYAETLDATVRVQVFGQPSDAILEALRLQAGNGVEISVNGEHLGGFTRSSAQR
jgi:uncharacterized protein (DUF2126 family)